MAQIRRCRLVGEVPSKPGSKAGRNVYIKCFIFSILMIQNGVNGQSFITSSDRNLLFDQENSSIVTTPKPQSEGVRENIYMELENGTQKSEMTTSAITLKHLEADAQQITNHTIDNGVILEDVFKHNGTTTRQNHDERILSTIANIPDKNGDGTKEIISMITESLNTLARYKHQLQRRSCKNNCGVSNWCSCKPICLILKTCCIDFEESCNDFYDLESFQRSHDWMKELEVQCFANNVVVKSCSLTNEPLSQSLPEYYPQTYLKPINATTRTSNEPMALGISDVLQLLLKTKPILEGNTTQISNVLLSIPIIDTSTGVSYRNISIYRCNGANASHAIPWSIDLIRLSPVPTFNDVEESFSDIDLASMFKVPYFYKNSDESSVEYCDTLAVKSCPHNYVHHSVREACEKYNLVMKVREKQEDSSLQEVLYKNPFCFYCNMKSSIQIESITIPGYRSASITRNTSFRVTFKKSGDGFSVGSTRNPFQLLPRWKDVFCYFELNLNNSELTKNQTDVANEESKDGDILTTKCRVESCRLGFHFNRCVLLETIILALPPTLSNPSQEDLNILFEAWKQMVLSNLPLTWNETVGQHTFMRSLSSPYTNNGQEYGYAFYIGVYSGTYGDRARYALLRGPVKNLMIRSNFTFQNDKQYACFTKIKLNAPPDLFTCSDNNWIDLRNESGLNIYSSAMAPTFTMYHVLLPAIAVAVYIFRN